MVLESRTTEKQYLQLNNVEAYTHAFTLSNKVWLVVSGWNTFAKDTIGKQWVRSIDSISANIAEGFGRYGRRDKAKFYYYAQGSVKESLDWLQKAKVRELISAAQYAEFFAELSGLPKLINSQIKVTFLKLTS